MKKELREHQTAMLDDARTVVGRAVAAGTPAALLLQLPTGGGKTVLACEIIEGATNNGLTVFFTVHRQELLDQAVVTLQKQGINPGIISADISFRAGKKCYVVSIDTFKYRLKSKKWSKLYPKPDIVIVDEAHHAVAPGWMKVLDHWRNQGSHIIGLTATPERLDGAGLEGLFDDLITGATTFELIERGYLSQYKLYAPDVGVDTSRLTTVRGDYSSQDLSDLYDNAKVIGHIVDHWEQRAKDKLTIAFGVRVDHSQHIADAFKRRGHPFEHLDGKTPRNERRAILRALGRGDIIGVSNCGLFGEGFDLEANCNAANEPGEPWESVTVECVISARRTQSLAVWLQQVGRSLRPKDDPAIILDHAGNTWLHGLPCQDREWSLEARKRKKGKAAVKECPNCFCFVPNHVMKCHHCGYVWIPEPMDPVDVAPDALVELDIAGMRERKLQEIYALRAEVEECETLDDLVALGERRGYNRPVQWAEHRWRESARRKEG